MGVLRFLLALAVVIGHATPILGVRLMHPSVAVQAFYLVSGFYMALILNERYVGRGSVGLFLSNRALRIYPTYWACAAFALLVVWAMPSSPFAPLASHWESLSLPGKAFLILTNVIVFGQDWTLFLGIDAASHGLRWTSNFWATDPKVQQFLVVPQAWSLGLELTFYLAAPWLVRRKATGLVALIAVLTVLRFVAYRRGYNFDPWTYRFLPFELQMFLFGALAYRLSSALRKLAVPRAVLAGGAMAVILATLLLPFEWSTDQSRGIWAYYALLVIGLPCLFELSRRSRWDNLIGELSFPMYLTHIAVIWLVSAFGLAARLDFGIVVVMLTVGASAVIYAAVVRPFDVIRARRVEARRGAAADAELRDAPGTNDGITERVPAR